jgi:beta-glucosidase
MEGALTRREVARGAAALGAAALLTGAGAARPPYRDPAQPIAVRVDDLLARMTIEEKVAQLVGVGDDKARFDTPGGDFDPARASAAFPHGFGHLCSPSIGTGGVAGETPTRSAGQCARYVNAVQRWAVEKTRLGIPVLGHEEALHGLRARGATSFPQAIGLASSWDPDLLTRVFTLAAAETRARGSALVLTPVVDVARDPRWGRVEETYGEDPFLTSIMGVAAIRGFQGGGSLAGLPADRVFATVKHFAGHGVPENGTNAGPLMMGERTLRETLLPPYRAAVAQGGAPCVMTAYHEVDGIPMAANHWLMTDVLRGEWGFGGVVISDYGAVRELVTIHHVARDEADAAAVAIMAGVDVELPDAHCFPHLPALVAAGRVPMSRIDEAVRRVLTMKFAAGLFENPYVDVAKADARTGTPAGRALAREAAGRTMVLLRNERDTLPLDPARVGRLAVIGVSAVDTPIGGYSDVPRQVVSVLDALRAEAADGRFSVDYATGVRLTRSRNWFADPVEPPAAAEASALRDEAVALARRCDCVLLVLGDNEQTAREAWSAGHMGDRSSLALFGEQEALAEAILALAKPVVVLLLNGRPPAIPVIAERADAILEGWYLGQETGGAVADVLFGRVNPGGKLPISIARSVGQLPIYYSRKPSARRGYLLDTTEPLYAFGHGLSYTRFELSAPRVSASTIRAGADVTVEVDVANVGARTGDEVVQVYVGGMTASVTMPVRALKAFRRVTLAPGERRTVRLTLPADSFAIWNRAMTRVIEPGTVTIEAGPGLDALKPAALTITA